MLISTFLLVFDPTATDATAVPIISIYTNDDIIICFFEVAQLNFQRVHKG